MWNRLQPRLIPVSLILAGAIALNSDADATAVRSLLIGSALGVGY